MNETLAGLLTTAECAVLVRRDQSTVRRWLKQGRLRGMKVGDTWFVYEESARAAEPPKVGRPRR